MVARKPLILSSFAREEDGENAKEIGMAEGSGSRCAAVDLAPLPWKSWGECLEGSIGGCGYASPKTVADFGIFSGDCVILQANRNKCAVQLYSWSISQASDLLSPEETTSLRDGVVYVRSAVFEALGRPPHVSIRPIKGRLGEADEVCISRVSRSDSSPTADYSDLIRAFLETPRIVSKGDVFAVWHLSDDLNEDDANGGGNLEKHEGDEKVDDGERPAGKSLIYFQIERLEPTGEDCLLIDCSKTQVMVEKSVNCFVPPLPPQALSPTLPLDQVMQLANLLTPIFHESMRDVELGVKILLSGPPGCGKMEISRAACDLLGVDLIEANVSSLTLASGKQAQAALESLVAQCVSCAPAILLLRKLSFVTSIESTPGAPPPVKSTWITDLESKIREALNKAHRQKVVMVGSVEDADELSVNLRACFSHEIVMSLPDDSLRESIIRHVTRRCALAQSCDLKALVIQTKGCTVEEILSAIGRAGQTAVSRMESPSCQAVLEEQDIKKAVDEQQAHSSAIGSLKIPNVSWNDVGGLEQVKKDILDTVQLPLQHPELFSSGMKRRSGVLLFGPPGTGKTLLAKAVATECSLSFLSVKGPELINMYIGESERNVRQVFKRAAEAAPCVIFFDELDSLAPNRGNGADSGGVMDRVVSQLLAEMDGTSGRTDVFVMGATNRPDLIDPALLRPGRFDKLLYCGLGGSSRADEQSQSQADIMAALTRKMVLAEDVNLLEIASSLPPTYTGADLYALCASAWQRAAAREVKRLTALGEGRDPEEDKGQVEVLQDDFWVAKNGVIPSVTPAMLQKYDSLRVQFAS